MPAGRKSGNRQVGLRTSDTKRDGRGNRSFEAIIFAPVENGGKKSL